MVIDTLTRNLKLFPGDSQTGIKILGLSDVLALLGSSNLPVHLTDGNVKCSGSIRQ